MVNNFFSFKGVFKVKRLFSIFFLSLVLLGLIFVGIFTKDNYQNEYLRIHIRANSNLQIDQDIKYQIKDVIVDFLTPIISSCSTKNEMQQQINKNLSKIVGIADQILAQNNFDYKSSAKLSNQSYFVQEFGLLYQQFLINFY